MISILITLIVIPLIPICFCVTYIPLTGVDWNLVNAKNTINIGTTVPMDVHMSLYNAKLIPDPYEDDNDVVFRNISWENWTMSHQFAVSSVVQNYKGFVLISRGIDTVATITINNKLIGTTDNMFRTYVFDMQSAIDFSRMWNNVSIAFSSPLSYVLKKAADYKSKYGYEVPINCPAALQHGECHANFIRKMQSSFSWDWGPAFPTMGIYDDNLSLLAFDTCIILQFSVVPTVDPSQQFWILNSDFILHCAQSINEASFSVTINEIFYQFLWISSVSVGHNRIQKSAKLPLNSVQKWWPNGLGEQKLYSVQGSFSTSSESDLFTVSVGFRTVELVQEQVQNFTDGLTFYFKINGLPVFLKGSNWIPADSFLDRITQDRLKFYFSSMKEANFNALRVWGGGVYETDYFYDFADEYGIMIFQDMMFAVNLYPSNLEFLENVGHEIYDQVNRLKHRPSIIVWAGNNENEVGLVQNWFRGDGSSDTYKSDYVKLYNNTIYSVINDTDYFSRPYLMSSPSNGLKTMRSGGIDATASSNIYGDVHVYNYYGNAWDPKNYPVPRCCTEYGFQAYPSIETLLSALSQEDLGYFNPAVVHRQHHSGSHMILLQQILMHFDLYPCNSKNESNKLTNKTNLNNFVKNTDELTRSCQASGINGKYFEEIVYLTQIHQAMAYKTETEHYRRWMSTVNNVSGEGLTMCALYWQLNDIWQAPTWASIDYGMKWKMVHYYAKNFFAPVLVSPFIDKEYLKVYVISDSAEPLTDTKLEINVHSWDSLKPRFTHKKVPLKTIQPATAALVYEDTLQNVLGSDKPENVDLFFNIRVLVGNKYNVSSSNVVFPHSFKLVPKDKLGKVTVSNVTTTKTPQVFLINLTTTSPAPFVWLDAKSVHGWFSDNGFTMITQNMQIYFKAWLSTVTLANVRESLTVTSLGDIYRRQNLK